MVENILVLTVGLPRSGKSTWAKTQISPIVNPDAIRLSMHGKDYIQKIEPLVWYITRVMVESLFLAGHKVIILDACNVSKERRKEWLNNQWKLRYVYFMTPIEECIRRAKVDDRQDLIPIIRRMNHNLEIPCNNEEFGDRSIEVITI